MGIKGTAQYVRGPDDRRLWKPSLTVLHTSVDLPGESVSAYQGCYRISGLCVCVYTLFPLGNRVFCSQVWVRMYCSMIPSLYLHVIVSFQAKFQRLYLCVAAVEGLLVRITLCKWVQGSRLTGVKWLGRYGFHEHELKITWKRSNST